MLVHKPPEPFDRVQVRAIRRNEMQLNPPTGLSQPLLHQPSMVITSIVEKDVNERQHRIERLNPDLDSFWAHSGGGGQPNPHDFRVLCLRAASSSEIS